MTLVPLVLYFNDRGRAKIQIGLAKGRRKQDKRQAAKDRDWGRDKARLLRSKG
jgi:SsrA-binding protein